MISTLTSITVINYFRPWKQKLAPVRFECMVGVSVAVISYFWYFGEFNVDLQLRLMHWQSRRNRWLEGVTSWFDELFLFPTRPLQHSMLSGLSGKTNMDV